MRWLLALLAFLSLAIAPFAPAMAMPASMQSCAAAEHQGATHKMPDGSSHQQTSCCAASAPVLPSNGGVDGETALSSLAANFPAVDVIIGNEPSGEDPPPRVS